MSWCQSTGLLTLERVGVEFACSSQLFAYYSNGFVDREHFVTPDSKADIFLVKERITYPHDRFEEKLIYYPNQFVFSLKMQNSRSRKAFSEV